MEFSRIILPKFVPLQLVSLSGIVQNNKDLSLLARRGFFSSIPPYIVNIMLIEMKGPSVLRVWLLSD